MSSEYPSRARIAAGAAAVAGGGFVVFQFAFEQGAEVGVVAWTLVAWTALFIMLAAAVVGAVAIVGYLWEELRGWRTRVEFTAEDGPAIAQVRIRNRGRTDSFVATATVLEVRERVNNRPFLRSFNLTWMGSGGSRADLSRGSL